MRAEISYDLVMGEDMGFVDGTFRLPGADWQVVIVSPYDVPKPLAVPQVWGSGGTTAFPGSKLQQPRRCWAVALG